MTGSATPATIDSTDGEHFVDLYAILGVSPTTPTPELRRRIAMLYTEAQDNLDHRSFRKRFYYHELYEVHLPHAHNALLDEARRAEYDAELKRRRPAKPGGPRTPALSGTRPPPSGEAPDGKASAGKTPAGKTATGPGAATPGAGSTVGGAASPGPAPNAPAVSGGRAPTPSWARMDKEVVERRRDSNRRELIKNELQAAGRRAAALGGFGAFAGAAVLLWFGAGAAGAATVIQSVATLPAFGAAYFSGRTASRAARRNIIATLSQMPYEELLMRYSH